MNKAIRVGPSQIGPVARGNVFGSSREKFISPTLENPIWLTHTLKDYKSGECTENSTDARHARESIAGVGAPVFRERTAQSNDRGFLVAPPSVAKAADIIKVSLDYSVKVGLGDARYGFGADSFGVPVRALLAPKRAGQFEQGPRASRGLGGKRMGQPSRQPYGGLEVSLAVVQFTFGIKRGNRCHRIEDPIRCDQAGVIPVL